jgi:hypothetical protein
LASFSSDLIRDGFFFTCGGVVSSRLLEPLTSLCYLHPKGGVVMKDEPKLDEIMDLVEKLLQDDKFLEWMREIRRMLIKRKRI